MFRLDVGLPNEYSFNWYNKLFIAHDDGIKF